MLCVNVLSCTLQNVKAQNDIQGVWACQKALRIRHLMFANNLMLFIKVTNTSSNPLATFSPNLKKL